MPDDGQYDDHVRVIAIPEYDRGELSGTTRDVNVAGERLRLSETANVTHVFEAIDASRDFSKNDKRYLDPEWAVLVRDVEAPVDDDGELVPPDDADIAPPDLSTIEDGDLVQVYRLPDERYPGYPEYTDE